MRAPVALNDLTERDWQRQVVELATTLGWRHFHDLRARGSDPGWPDLALVRDRLVLLELKSEKGKLRPAQAVWLDALLRAGCEAYVVRPSDLDALGKVLAHRKLALKWPYVAPRGGAVLAAFEQLSEATRVEVRGVLGREAQAA